MVLMLFVGICGLLYPSVSQYWNSKTQTRAVENYQEILNSLNKEDYEIYFEALDVASIANAVRSVPQEYINAEKNGVTEACLRYLAPLVVGELPVPYKNGIPVHFSFDK